jgi:undecaprenyl-diphosphatase
MPDLTYAESIVIGLLQGVSELFPVSSLGHSVLFPAVVGGKWAQDLSVTAEGSPYLAVLVAMHVATALALVIFFWRDWVRVVGGLLTSIRDRRIESPDQRLGWLLVVGTIPVGIAGLLLEHSLKDFLGKPVPSAVFLTLNGLVLYSVERLRRGRQTKDEETPVELRDTVQFATEETTPLSAVAVEVASDRRLSRLSIKEAGLIGASQALALFPGISRSGITITAGLLRGLRHEDAARFAFLLATPVILAAGVLKIPELFTPEMSGVVGPAVVGSLVAGVASYISVRFLTSYFETRTLIPFAIYCVAAGLGCLAWFSL